jgi:ATP-dependent helicase YprA (DUF1998 family)
MHLFVQFVLFVYLFAWRLHGYEFRAINHKLFHRNMKMNMNKVNVPPVSPDTLTSVFYSKKSFQEIGVPENMVASLRSLGIERPSRIQSLSYQTIRDKNDCIMADQTGSGKTLGYLVPLLVRILDSKLNTAANILYKNCPAVSDTGYMLQ